MIDEEKKKQLMPAMTKDLIYEKGKRDGFIISFYYKSACKKRVIHPTNI